MSQYDSRQGRYQDGGRYSRGNPSGHYQPGSPAGYMDTTRGMQGGPGRQSAGYGGRSGGSQGYGGGNAPQRFYQPMEGFGANNVGGNQMYQPGNQNVPRQRNVVSCYTRDGGCGSTTHTTWQCPMNVGNQFNRLNEHSYRAFILGAQPTWKPVTDTLPIPQGPHVPPPLQQGEGVGWLVKGLGMDEALQQMPMGTSLNTQQYSVTKFANNTVKIARINPAPTDTQGHVQLPPPNDVQKLADKVATARAALNARQEREKLEAELADLEAATSAMDKTRKPQPRQPSKSKSKGTRNPPLPTFSEDQPDELHTVEGIGYWKIIEYERRQQQPWNETEVSKKWGPGIPSRMVTYESFVQHFTDIPEDLERALKQTAVKKVAAALNKMRPGVHPKNLRDLENATVDASD